MTDTQVYERLLQVRACADLRTAEMLKDLITEFESRERSKKAPSKSVAALVKAFPASWMRHIKAGTRSALQYGHTMDHDGQRLQMVTDRYMLIGFRTESEAMEYGQCQWDMMTDAMQERYRQNPHGYHRLSMDTIWTDDDMDADCLTAAVLAQDFGTELHDWTK